MKILYPEIEPYNEFELKVSELHTIHVEESGNKKDALITAFLVDKDSVGLSVQSGYSSLCHPAYRNFILEFDDCIVSEENVLGEVHRGFQVANEWLMSTRLQVAAMALGRAHRAFEESREWAANRKQFGQPIGRFQGVSYVRLRNLAWLCQL